MHTCNIKRLLIDSGSQTSCILFYFLCNIKKLLTILLLMCEERTQQRKMAAAVEMLRGHREGEQVDSEEGLGQMITPPRDDTPLFYQVSHSFSDNFIICIQPHISCQNAWNCVHCCPAKKNSNKEKTLCQLLCPYFQSINAENFLYR